MVVVSYDWYKATYGGELDEATFNRLSARAFLFADAMTEYRLGKRWKALPESLKTGIMTAICAFVDQAKVEESGGPVLSETNDGISRTYAAGSSSSSAGSSSGHANAAQTRLADTIRVYLAPTGLLYRGRGR